MKNLILALFILTAFSSYSQTVSYVDLENGKVKKGNYTSYISKLNNEYKIDDEITIGNASGPNGEYVYVFGIIAMATTVETLKQGFPQKTTTITKIKVGGNKRMGLVVSIMGTGWTFNSKLAFDFEGAMESGELVGEGMTSRLAMTMLKEAKEKLDLQLITQQEYDSIKTELAKYIK